MSLFQISCLITSLVSFLFGFFAFLNNRRSKLNIFWFFASLSISVWSVGFFGVVSAKSYNVAWFSQYVLDIGGIFIPILFFNFILQLLSLEKKYRKSRIISFIVAIFLVILNFTPLFKKGVASYAGFNYWISPGPLYLLFPISFLFFSVYASILLIKRYRENADRLLKAQIKYVLLAQLFGVGGGVTNFFPQLFKVYPFGNYLVALYIIFISYAIFKHHLFNVRVIATELFTVAISITLLIRTLLSNSYHELLINGILLIAVAGFGVLLVRSVTKEVKQREEIEKMAERIKQAYEVEKSARTELERLDVAKNQFIMATQHHLRTPLTSMRGYIDLLMTGSYGRLTPRIRETIVKFESSTKRLLRIVNELLDISQFQLGKEVVTLKPNTDMGPIMKEIIDELKFEAESKKIYLKLTDSSPAAPTIKADPEKLKVALFNLVDNAIKYTSEGGVIISLEASNGNLRIIIKDTGMGIPLEEQKDLFTRLFERTKDAQETNTTGRGIGLYITYQIIKAHHGKVWVESDGHGKGATFFVELPQ